EIAGPYRFAPAIRALHRQFPDRARHRVHEPAAEVEGAGDVLARRGRSGVNRRAAVGLEQVAGPGACGARLPEVVTSTLALALDLSRTPARRAHARAPLGIFLQERIGTQHVLAGPRRVREPYLAADEL